jgi:hypothetical protein
VFSKLSKKTTTEAVVAHYGRGILKTNPRIEDDSMPQTNCQARDEMNLAEFPLCALSHRLKPEMKTLRFEDRKWDEGRNDYITRQLTITGSDAYGLPTEKDDEVLLGLIQLTRLCGFADRKVFFTRHELIRMLGWRDDSKSYARVEASLNRWTGVTLYYNNAWWNKERQCWLKESFHILDNVWLCHRGEPPPDVGLPATGGPMSAFVWNEVIFRSFTHGNLKSIDFDFYKSLRSAVAKRLYRFLDKRFWHCNRREFKLRELCCEHIGLSRNYDTANLKRKLLSGIQELEERGFIRASDARFRKLRRGQWEVIFERATEPSRRRLAEPIVSDPLMDALTQRGISASVAQQTVERFPAERIQHHLAVFDWLLNKQDSKVSRSPAGFLVRSIEENYSPPKLFPRGGLALAAKPTFSEEQDEAINKHRIKIEVESNERNRAINDFWTSLSDGERQALESQALTEARELERNLVERGGAFAATARRKILDAYAWKRLQKHQ